MHSIAILGHTKLGSINSVNGLNFAIREQFIEQVSSKYHQYMKQIGILFGANHCRNSDNRKEMVRKTKARIRKLCVGGITEDGECIMPTYLKAKSPEDGWIRVVRKIMDNGMVRVDERGSETKWHSNVMIHIADPYVDRVSKKYPFSEGVLKEKYATQLLNPDRLDFDYTYGERLNAWGDEINQIDYVITKLKESPNSRRAVATTWDPRKDTIVDEVPCLNHFVFMVREGLLDLSVMIRSNDMYGAWPANVYALGELLAYVSENTNLKPGTITTLSVNAHIYKNDWSIAEEV